LGGGGIRALFWAMMCGSSRTLRAIVNSSLLCSILSTWLELKHSVKARMNIQLKLLVEVHLLIQDEVRSVDEMNAVVESEGKRRRLLGERKIHVPEAHSLDEHLGMGFLIPCTKLLDLLRVLVLKINLVQLMNPYVQRAKAYHIRRTSDRTPRFAAMDVACTRGMRYMSLVRRIHDLFTLPNKVFLPTKSV
jgi:hypothetical protein